MKLSLRRTLLAIVLLAAAFGAYQWVSQRKAAAQASSAAAEAAKVVAQTLELAPSDIVVAQTMTCLLYTSPSPRDRTRSRMPSSA